MRDKFILFMLSIAFGLVMSISPAISRASVAVEVFNSNGEVNFQGIDAMQQSQDGRQVKFAEMDGNELILSDKPIIKAENQSKTYKPTRLADLGYQFNPGAVHPEAIMTQLAAYDVVDSQLYQMPAIPAEVVSAATPIVTASAAPAQIATLPNLQTMSSSYASHIVMQSAVVLFMIVLFGSVIVYLINAIQASVDLRTSPRQSKNEYKGEWRDATTMVGHGDLFDFKRNAIHGAIPMNTNALNMLCSVGKFSRTGTADTYFYMAYYVPSQHAYAAALREKQEEKQVELEQ